MQYTEDDEELENTNEECAFTVNDLKSLAKNYLNVFFKDVSTREGEILDADILHTERNISMVLNLNICDGMPLIYKAMEPKFDKRDDLIFVIAELLRCSKLGLPKCFATGMLGVYLEVCKGCKLNFEA